VFQKVELKSLTTSMSWAAARKQTQNLHELDGIINSDDLPDLQRDMYMSTPVCCGSDRLHRFRGQKNPTGIDSGLLSDPSITNPGFA
jgi:hypothetical protein